MSMLWIQVSEYKPKEGCEAVWGLILPRQRSQARLSELARLQALVLELEERLVRASDLGIVSRATYLAGILEEVSRRIAVLEAQLPAPVLESPQDSQG